MHSSLKITPSQSDASQSLWVRAQASFCLACFFVKSALFFVRHFLMFSSANARFTVLIEQCGATTLRNSLKGCRRSFLVSLTSLRQFCGVNILLLPSVGMFSV